MNGNREVTYVIACKDIGIDNCAFEAKGDTVDAAVRKMINHLTHDHQVIYEAMLAAKSKEQIEADMKGKAREA